ncbi:hypothetical protein [Nocardia sp. NPDC003979]
MEILVILAVVVVVAAVVLWRKTRSGPKPPDEPEWTGNPPR